MSRAERLCERRLARERMYAFPLGFLAGMLLVLVLLIH